jgi:dCTP diphosphatase
MSPKPPCKPAPTISDVLCLIRRFRDERDWMQFHNPKDMAIALSLETSELLELFLWKTPEQTAAHAEANKPAIRDEIADIAIYLFELADNLGIDLLRAMEQKPAKNAQRYPVEKAKGKHLKYTGSLTNASLFRTRP